MKIRKPDDEKYFKDIVLNDILVEISNESDAVNTTPLQKEKKKFLPTKMSILLLTILTLVTVLMLLKKQTESTINTEEIKLTHKEQTDTAQSWKMDKDQEVYTVYKGEKQIEQIKIKKNPTEKIDVSKSQTIYKEPKVTKLKPIPIQKTQRVLAKEALRQQMLN